jgi:RNA 3'-terminal phosphate cyclase
MALAGAGAFVTVELSRHATTNLATIQEFLGTRFAVEPLGGVAHRVWVRTG